MTFSFDDVNELLGWNDSGIELTRVERDGVICFDAHSAWTDDDDGAEAGPVLCATYYVPTSEGWSEEGVLRSIASNYQAGVVHLRSALRDLSLHDPAKAQMSALLSWNYLQCFMKLPSLMYEFGIEGSEEDGYQAINGWTAPEIPFHEFKREEVSPLTNEGPTPLQTRSDRP